MTFLYQIAIGAAAGAVSLLPRSRKQSKFRQFVAGQRQVWQFLEQWQRPADGRIIWLHASSLGEYAVLKPLIDRFRQAGLHVVLTFFSPTGFTHFADHGASEGLTILPMPLDTRRNVRRFLDLVRPSAAIFSVSEYWCNYLHELRVRDIPAFLVAAKITDKSPFYGLAGRFYRSLLPLYRRIFAIDEDTCRRLQQMGMNDCEVASNPLFDNALAKVATPYSDPVIEAFAQGRPLFVAGSIHDARDLELVSTLAAENPDQPFLFVPHAVEDEMLRDIRNRFGDKVRFYSQCDATTDFSGTQVLVIDFVGKLALMYRYGDMAYIGGGFTPYLHSLVEAVAYGLPVAFGPETGRKITPGQLQALGLGRKVSTPEELSEWYRDMRKALADSDISERCREYVRQGSGGDVKISDQILKAMR